LILLLAAPGFAQFRDLTTTDDGEQFYFSSELRLKGTDDLTSEKILRYVDGHFETFRQVACVSTLPQGNHCQQSESQVSGDGRVVTNTQRGYCRGGSSCIGYVAYSGVMAGATVPSGASLWNGSVRMSRNARFIARLGANTWIPMNPGNQLIDLVQGAYTSLPPLSFLGTQSLSDDGMLLASVSTGPLLWKSGIERRLQFSQPIGITGAQLSSNGRTIVYEGRTAGGCVAFSYDVASAREVELGPIPCQSEARRSILSISNDGLLVLYSSPASSGAPERLLLQSTSGGSARVLLDPASGVAQAVLSGYANVAYAVTKAGGILKIHVATGFVEELSKPTVVITSLNSEIAPGMRLELPWQPFESSGIRTLRIDDREAPLIGMIEDRAVFQVPWETEPEQPARVRAPDDSLFEQALSAPVSTGQPWFYFWPEPGYVPYPVPIAAHEDFRSLVTGENPARRGEIVHLYLTGLGRVSPPIGTGEVTPAEPLRYVDNPLVCRYPVAGGWQSMQILFAGLAPGFIGVNQVDVRLPEAAEAPDFRFECNGRSASLPVDQ
jgi:uncharacterized protein (TIGR03437 family)